jgi:hypothetical protein
MSDIQHYLPTALPPLASEILSEQLWFGDNEPIWHGSISSQEAAQKRLKCIKRLRRFAQVMPAAQSLAERLEVCGPKQRCMSGACPECTRAFQRWFTDATYEFAWELNSYGHLVAVSLVFSKFRTPLASLGPDALGLRRALARALERSSDLAWMIGGLDISLNDDTQKGLDIAWQPQVYGQAFVQDLKAFTSHLKQEFPGTRFVARPVHIREAERTYEAISYAFKCEFVERIAYRSTRNSTGREFWSTRKVSLVAIDHVQLLLWLNDVGLAGRLYLRGVRMVRTDNGVALARVKKNE